jgi:hypothetical protein
MTNNLASMELDVAVERLRTVLAASRTVDRRQNAPIAKKGQTLFVVGRDRPLHRGV